VPLKFISAIATLFHSSISEIEAGISQNYIC